MTYPEYIFSDKRLLLVGILIPFWNTENKIPGANFENKAQMILVQVRKVRSTGKGVKY